MINVSTVAHITSKTLRASGFRVAHTASLELIAALFGYGTYAALQNDPAADLDELFAGADHVVLQPAKLKSRMRKLQLEKIPLAEVSQAALDACRRTVEADGEVCKFHESMSDFQDFIFEDVQIRAHADDEVSSAYAGTNAYIDEFYTEVYEFDHLLEEGEEWTLVASGSHTGEIDPDRAYSGHAGNFSATYTFEKVGRCGLRVLDVEFGLDFDRDYR